MIIPETHSNHFEERAILSQKSKYIDVMKRTLQNGRMEPIPKHFLF